MGIIQRQGLKNAAISYTGILIGVVSTLFIQTKFLDKDVMGLSRTLYNFSILLSTIFPLGITSISIKYFPFFRDQQKKHHGYFGLMLLVALVGFSIVSLLLFLLKPWIIAQYSAQSDLFGDYFFIIFPYVLTLGLVSIFMTYAFSLFKTVIPSFFNEVFPRLSQILVIMLFHWKLIGLDGFIGLFYASYAIPMLLILAYIWKIDRPSLKIDFDFLRSFDFRSMMVFGLLMAVTSLALQGFKSLDVVVLGTFKNMAEVGIYSVAAFIPTILEAPLNALNNITNPKIAQAWVDNDQHEIQKIYYRSTRYLMLLGGLLFVGINHNLDALFRIIPNNYEGGIPIAMALSVGSYVNSFSSINSSIVFNSPKYKVGILLLFLYFPITFLNYKFFIPVYGTLGVAVATAASIVLICTIRWAYIWYQYKFQPFDASSLRIVFVVVAAWLFNYMIPHWSNPFLEIFFRSITTLLVYILFVRALQIVPELEEMALNFIRTYRAKK